MFNFFAPTTPLRANYSHEYTFNRCSQSTVRLNGIKMFISVPTCLIFAEMLIVSRSAPKLGPILYDPLTFEIGDKNPNNENQPPPVPIAAKILVQRRNMSEESMETPQAKCSSYDYDPKNCKMINNRILCGYNKNVGKIENNEEFIDLGNGCRVRGDRMECGYVDAPYGGIRRPPVTREALETTKKTERARELPHTILKAKVSQSTNSPNTSKVTTEASSKYSTIKTTTIPTFIPIQTTSEIMNTTNKDSTTISDTTKTVTTVNTTNVTTIESTTMPIKKTTTQKRAVTMCVEKKDYIVCYDKPSDQKKAMRKRRRSLGKTLDMKYYKST